MRIARLKIFIQNYKELVCLMTLRELRKRLQFHKNKLKNCSPVKVLKQSPQQICLSFHVKIEVGEVPT